MKKALSSLLTICIIATMGLAINAEGTDTKRMPLPTDPVDELIENLSPDSYGGVYQDGDTLIIQTISKPAVKKSMAATKSTIDNIDFKQATYTMNQLKDAKELLLNRAEEFGITAVGFDEANNAVLVYLKDLSEDNQSAVTGVSPVKNITFRKGETITTLEPENQDSEQIDRTAKANAINIYGGNWLYTSRLGRFSTLATSVSRFYDTSSQQDGFLTCGHGYRKDEPVYYKGANGTHLGNITKKLRNTLVDAAFIESSHNSTGEMETGEQIRYQGNPKTGNKIAMFGVNGKQEGYVTGTGITITANSDQDGRQRHTNVFSYNCKGILGDSGCAIAVANGSYYKIVGIQTAGTSSECYGIEWSDIRNAFDLTATA